MNPDAFPAPHIPPTIPTHQAVPLTVMLNNGREVLAKIYYGELFAVTYSNRMQAYKKAAQLGAPWTVFHWGRPFYVGQDKSEVRYWDEIKGAA